VEHLRQAVLDRDDTARSPWIHNGGTFLTGDTPRSLTAKAAYIKNTRLRGAMMYSLDGDTADGALTRAIADGLGG